jgi:hypothetical protein
MYEMVIPIVIPLNQNYSDLQQTELLRQQFSAGGIAKEHWLFIYHALKPCQAKSVPPDEGDHLLVAGKSEVVKKLKDQAPL